MQKHETALTGSIPETIKNGTSNANPEETRQLPFPHTEEGKMRSLFKRKSKPTKLMDQAAKPTKKRFKRKKHTPGFTRRLWNDSEDMAISELVKKYGTKRWSLIAKKLGEEFNITGRSGKQCRERWHNHLDPEVIKDPITPEEEKQIFMGQREHGNKWAEIAKLLPGRPDNVVKNHFYSTLRRQLRKVLKEIKGESAKCPNKVSIEYMWEVMKGNNVPYTILDNENVRALLEYIDSNPDKAHALSEDQENPKEKQSKYSLYPYLKNVTKNRRESAKEKVAKRLAQWGKEEESDLAEKPIKLKKKRKPYPAQKLVPTKRNPRPTMSISTRPSKVSSEVFIVPNESKKHYKIISKKSMDDTDLLVNLHNAVSPHNKIVKDVQKFDLGAFPENFKANSNTARKLDMDQYQQDVTPHFGGGHASKLLESINELQQQIEPELFPRNSPLSKAKRPPALNMDLIAETSLSCPGSVRHEIVVPIPRPPLSPIMALSSARHQIGTTANRSITESPAKPPLSPLAQGTGFIQMASTPTLLRSIDKMFKEANGNIH